MASLSLTKRKIKMSKNKISKNKLWEVKENTKIIREESNNIVKSIDTIITAMDGKLDDASFFTTIKYVFIGLRKDMNEYISELEKIDNKSKKIDNKSKMVDNKNE